MTAQMEARPYPRTLVNDTDYQLFTELTDDGFFAMDNLGWRDGPRGNARAALIACEDRLIQRAQLTGDQVAGPSFAEAINA